MSNGSGNGGNGGNGGNSKKAKIKLSCQKGAKFVGGKLKSNNWKYLKRLGIAGLCVAIAVNGYTRYEDGVKSSTQIAVSNDITDDEFGNSSPVCEIEKGKVACLLKPGTIVLVHRIEGDSALCSYIGEDAKPHYGYIDTKYLENRKIIKDDILENGIEMIECINSEGEIFTRKDGAQIEISSGETLLHINDGNGDEYLLINNGLNRGQIDRSKNGFESLGLLYGEEEKEPLEQGQPQEPLEEEQPQEPLEEEQPQELLEEEQPQELLEEEQPQEPIKQIQQNIGQKPAEITKKMYVNTDGANLNIRSVPGEIKEENIIGTLERGADVFITNNEKIDAEGNSWVEIQVNGKTGWVRLEFLSNEDPNENSNEIKEEKSFIGQVIRYVDDWFDKNAPLSINNKQIFGPKDSNEKDTGR